MPIHPAHTYHVHTTWSDGQAGVSAMVAAAAGLGFHVIGISDHFGLLPDGTEVFGMRRGQFDGYVEDVCAARARSAGIEVRLGLELDYIPGAEHLLAEYLRRAPFDYVLGSVHFLDGFPIDRAAADWEALTPQAVDGIWRGYWRNVQAMADARLVDVVGHLDLPKKYRFYPGAEPVAERTAALDAIARAGMAVELNAAGWDKPCGEAYPSEALLRECFARGIPVVVSDDAHAPGDLGRHFPEATALLRRVGWRECSTFAGRRRNAMPL